MRVGATITYPEVLEGEATHTHNGIKVRLYALQAIIIELHSKCKLGVAIIVEGPNKGLIVHVYMDKLIPLRQ